MSILSNIYSSTSLFHLETTITAYKNIWRISSCSVSSITILFFVGIFSLPLSISLKCFLCSQKKPSALSRHFSSFFLSLPQSSFRRLFARPRPFFFGRPLFFSWSVFFVASCKNFPCYFCPPAPGKSRRDSGEKRISESGSIRVLKTERRRSPCSKNHPTSLWVQCTLSEKS